MRKNAEKKLFSSVKCNCKETAKLSFKNAADNTKNLRLVKKMMLLMEIVAKQMKMPTLTLMMVTEMRKILLMISLLLTLLFREMAYGIRGVMTHSTS